LGLKSFRREGDTELVEELWRALVLTETDMTLFFRQLADVALDSPATSLLERLEPAFYAPDELKGESGAQLTTWLRRYLDRVSEDGTPDTVRREAMNRVNPKYVLRNYLAQEVITAAEQGDDEPVLALLEVMRRPYDEQAGNERYALRRPEWARNRPGCSMLSCSS